MTVGVLLVVSQNILRLVFNHIVMQMDKMVKRQAVTPGGLLMDIVLTPALKPGPRLALNLKH